MKTEQHKIILDQFESDRALNNNLWIVILHATRVPPHIGLLFNGKYFSLNIKGVEKNIEMDILLRTIELQKIKTIFIKLKNHPVFSIEFLKEVFENDLLLYKKVTIENTCFKPVKLFLKEHYLFCEGDINYLYELFPILYKNNMIEKTIGMNMKEDLSNSTFIFKPYEIKEIKDKLNSIAGYTND